jgi:hypothetical protein
MVVPILTRVLWLLALASVLSLFAKLLFRLPSPKPNVLHPVQPDVSALRGRPPLAPPSPNCCIATVFDNSSITQTVALGHSLRAVSPTYPRAIAFQLSPIAASTLSILEKYFSVVRVADSLPEGAFPEFLFWDRLSDCFPVVAVNHTSVFNRGVESLCRAAPFSSVSRIGDIVFFDPSLMIIDPTAAPPTKSTEFINFAKLINSEIIDWKPLPTDSLVVETECDYLDFWFRYGSPIYIRFNESSFARAAVGPRLPKEPPLFEMMTKIVGAAASAHPEVFEGIRGEPRPEM